MKRWTLAAAVIGVVVAGSAAADDGVALTDAAWVYNNLITESDPTAWRGATYQGEGERVIWDPYGMCWCAVDVYLFEGTFAGRPGVTEFQVHSEYGSEEGAREMVDLYGPILGRLPRAMRENAQEVEITIGPPGSGAGGRDGIFHIHTNSWERDLREGHLEEIFFHEASHVSLDHIYAHTPGWRAA